MMRLVRLVLLAGVLWPLGAAFGPALAVEIGYDYDVYVGGSQVAEMRITVDRAGDRYRITSAIDLVGMASVLSDWSARGVTEGRIDGARPVPDSFASHNFFRGEDRRVELAYAGGAITSVVAVPSNEEDEREPVSAAQQQGTIDPLSAVLAATLSPADCGGDQRLFDGRRLTVIAVDGVGPAEAPKTDYGIYAGPATLCTVTLTRSGGTSPRWEGERSTPSRVSVWLAAVAGDLAVPVRLEADTSWGELRGHLVGVQPLGATN